MPFPDDDLIASLRALSAAQLRDAAAYINNLRLRTSLPDLPEQSEGCPLSQPGYHPASADSKRVANIEVFSEALSIAIALVDDHGLIAFANTSAETMFGYGHGELAHQHFTLLFPDAPAGFEANTSLDAGHDLHRQSEQGGELRGRKKDGSAIALKIGWSSIQLADRRFAVASITDVTVGESIEGALRKYEEQRALIFSDGILGGFSWNIERDEVEAHPTVFKLYGAAPIAGPVPGDWFRSRQHPDDRDDVDKTWRSQIEAGGDLAVEFRVNGDDGVMRWIECRGIVIHDAQGTPRQVHGLNIDITSRKWVELERRQSEARAVNAEERLRTAVQFSGAAVWRWRPDEDTTEWFGPVSELTGVHQSDLASFAAFKKIIFPADRAPLEQTLAHCLATGAELRHEFRIVRPDGEIRWVAGHGGVLRDAAGRVYGLSGVSFDITDRKAVEEELTQSERNFRQLTSLVPQIVFTFDASGAIEYLNERFFEVSGFSSASEASAHWAELLSEEDRESTVQTWLTGVASGQVYERECRIWDRRFEQHRWQLVRAIPVRNAGGALVRWIGTATDVHDQKTAAERLEYVVESRTLDLKQSLTLVRKREEQLEKSLQEKDALLREIHHRVKNNLQIVSSLLSMQAANAVNSAAVAPLRDSERRISSMAMIHEQLYGTDDMQTLEFAQHVRSLSESLLDSMAGNSLVSCSLDLHPVNLTIHQAIPCALILNELLTNALKYAYPGKRGGKITVRLSSNSGLATLTVSDEGAGLPSHVDPFLPKTLGLEIIKVLVSQLDGELIVAGPPGASFTVRFRPHETAVDANSLQGSSTALKRG